MRATSRLKAMSIRVRVTVNICGGAGNACLSYKHFLFCISWLVEPSCSGLARLISWNSLAADAWRKWPCSLLSSDYVSRVSFRSQLTNKFPNFRMVGKLKLYLYEWSLLRLLFEPSFSRSSISSPSKYGTSADTTSIVTYVIIRSVWVIGLKFVWGMYSFHLRLQKLL